MIFNMFSKDVPRWFERYLADTRVLHASLGGLPEEFSSWFKKEYGVSMLGVCCVVPDETASYATLKYAQEK